MPIHFVCPLGHKLSVPDDLAGTQGRCGVCHQRFFVPLRDADAAKDEMKEDVPAVDVDAHVAVPNEARVEVPSAALRPEELGTESRVSAAAAQEAETPGHPAQPPPSPWRNPVAPAASPPPLPPSPGPPPTLLSPPAPASEGRSPERRASIRWLAWKRSDALERYAISRPNPRQLEVAYWLASLLPFGAAFCAAPALPHLQFAGAPAWAQLMLCAAVLHMGYAAWLALLPDESTVRVGMYLFAITAVAYLAAVTALCSLDNSQLFSLGLSGVRGPAVAWCGLVFVMASLTSGVCGRIAGSYSGS